MDDQLDVSPCGSCVLQSSLDAQSDGDQTCEFICTATVVKENAQCKVSTGAPGSRLSESKCAGLAMIPDIGESSTTAAAADPYTHAASMVHEPEKAVLFTW
jgi:hypothetical protein